MRIDRCWVTQPRRRFELATGGKQAWMTFSRITNKAVMARNPSGRRMVRKCIHE
jgi:hypothetical protein